jgi:hypothetical protein
MLLNWKDSLPSLVLSPISAPYYLVFNNDGDGEGGNGGEGGGNGDGGKGGEGGNGGSDGAGAGAGDGSGADDDKPKFSQKQLNKMLAENKKNLQQQVTSQIKELETLRKSANLSEKEKADLSKRIEDLSSSLLTKDELAAKEKEKLSSQHKMEREQLSGERDFYRTLYETTTIERDIFDEAARHDVYRESQIVELLRPKSRITEVVDSDGKPIKGRYITKIRLEDVDKEGKPTTLDLTVAEALKRMKERPNDFGNLFKSGVSGGLGDGKNRSSGKELDPSELAKTDPKRYREWRKSRGY